MSGVALRWAHAQTAGNLTLKAVLIAIASRADHCGSTWASQSVLAADLECDVRTIRRSLQALEEKGLVRREERMREDGSRASDLLCLPIPAGDRNAGGGDRKSGGYGHQARGVGTDSPEGGGRQSPLTTFEPTPNQQGNQPSSEKACAWPVDFREQFRSAYPHWVKGLVAFAELDRLHREGDVPFSAILNGVALYVASKPPDRNWMGPDRFLADRRFEDRPAPIAPRLIRSDGAPNRRPYREQPTGHAAVLADLYQSQPQEPTDGTGSTDIISFGEDGPPVWVSADDQPARGRGEDRGLAWAAGSGGRPAEPLLRAARSGAFDPRAAAALRRRRAS